MPVLSNTSVKRGGEGIKNKATRHLFSKTNKKTLEKLKLAHTDEKNPNETREKA